MDGEWHERDDRPGRGSQAGTMIFGALLIALGAAFLVSEQVNFNWGEHGWPIFVIVPGLFLLLVGLAMPSEAGLGLAIPGGIITSVGLLLAFQDATGAWASWAYAWALIAPGSVGATLSLYGLLHRRMDLLDAGLRTAAVGLGLFVGIRALLREHHRHRRGSPEHSASRRSSGYGDRPGRAHRADERPAAAGVALRQGGIGSNGAKAGQPLRRRRLRLSLRPRPWDRTGRAAPAAAPRGRGDNWLGTAALGAGRVYRTLVTV